MSDLTSAEQTNVRTALRFLRARCGSWEGTAKLLRTTEKTLTNVAHGQTPSITLAFRLARVAGVLVDDVVTGKYPPAGTCPYCGHRPESPTTDAAR